MAKSKRNTTKRKKETPTETPAIKAPSKKQWRLGAGMFLLFIGVFICFSVISYCFTWQQDQSELMSQGSIWAYLKAGGNQPANWGGRLGAAISHLLVYKWVGIASLAIGMFITIGGLGLLYGKRIIPVARYIRWSAILILLVAPLLTYLMPDASFSFGGAWGNEAIAYMNGLIGSAGTGLLLLGIVCFFVFVVFALDISPILRKAKKAAKKVAETAATLKPEKTESTTSEEAEPAEELKTGNTATEGVQPLESIEEETEQEDLNIELIDNQAEQHTVNDMYANKEEPTVNKVVEETPTPEPPVQEANTEVELNVPEAENKTKKKTEPTDEENLSFEVNQTDEEKIIPQHGGHISIQDNEKYAPELDLPDYHFPTLDLLEDREQQKIVLDKDELEQNKNQIIQTLRSFNIEIQRISATVGPTVTLYEIVPAEGVRISKIRNLEDDIALNLAALGIRIIAPIPGRGTIGIEVPNANKQIVTIRGILSSEKFATTKMSLPIALGKKIDNENYIVDLATMPHLLMAGATGQGKSVGINTILVSLLYKKHPSQLKFVMIDPKKVELSIYRTIENHFLAKLPDEEEAIITDTKKVINTLNSLCIEMDNRYELLKEAGSRNIKEYNAKFIRRKLNPEKGHKYLPFIVLVIDEFADLMMTAGKEVEMPIARLAQLARAVGIHLIIATQRPSVNVITGTIKANFPARIAFKVSAKVDSRTILDAGGAEQLIGRGDMLISFGSELLRLQCAFVDTPEVENVTDFIGEQRGYPSAFELPEYEGDDGGGSDKKADLTNRDKLFEECARTVVTSQSGSTSMLQRRFNLGYNRAGRIMDQLEAADIVGPSAGSKPREVLVHTEAELEQLLNSL